jgi:formate hydrogenlyase subunit 3/multisubunit Na+/H+ antiporter MnhD subunit
MEANTLSVVFLVTFYWRRESMEAGYKYLLLVSVGVTFALLGCILIYCGAIPYLPGRRLLLLTEIGKIARVIPESIVLIACAMFIVGFGTKAGLIPFHAWLPDAHSEAPVPISALLSGIVIKIGAYVLARTVTIFAPTYPAVVTFVAILASVGMVIGIIMALVQDDLKRLLAYSSVSQIAYVIEGLGLGTYLGIYGGLYHLINHTISKALLFLCAGALMYSAGTRKISELRLVAKKMPVTGFCFFVGALAIGGMPPFNGFMSKFTLFLAAADSKLLWAAVIGIFTGLLTIACFAWTAYRIFWTKPQHDSHGGANPGHEAGVETPAQALEVQGAKPLYEAKEVPVSMWIGMIILALLCIALGVYPRLIYPILDSAAKCILSILKV